MELKTFDDDDFDPKKWINKAWSSSGSQDKEVFVSNTMSRLQLYMKQLTNSLDETTTQIVNSMPRILEDASSFQIEGTVLQGQLAALEKKVQDVEDKTGQSIESLQRIDDLKSRLESAAAALREADKWAALASSLEDTLNAGVPKQKDKLVELGQQVAALTASLEMLIDSPDYSEKQLQLETLYNRLEATISTPMIHALQQEDADLSAVYVAIATNMGRWNSCGNAWRQVTSSKTASRWSRLDGHSVTVLRDTLCGDMQTQIEWLTTVLKCETPVTELIRLYTDLLLSIDPTPGKIVSANMKLCESPQDGVVYLIDVRIELDQFVNTVRVLIDAPSNNKEQVPTNTLRDLGRSLYAPLRDMLPKYTDLQKQIFNEHIDHKQLEQEDLIERSRAFQNVAERCEIWLYNALSSAKKIAGNAIYPHFIAAVEAFTSSLLSNISSHTRRIEAQFLSCSNSGVLSDTFPASLSLAAAVATLLDVLPKLISDVILDVKESAPEDNPLYNTTELLTDDTTRQRLASLLTSTQPVPSVDALRREGATLKSLAVNILRSPINKQLDKIPTLLVWNNNDALSTDLPDFALSPQEYITEIGQYLITLPQHLEMHLPEKQAPWQFLTEVCNHTCEKFAEKILNIRNMDQLGTKRCLTDIETINRFVTPQRFTPVQLTSEHSTPLPSTSQRFYPLPSNSEHSTPLPSTSEHSTPLPSNSEHSTPLPSTSEHSTPLPSTSEHSTPLPSTSEHSTPLPSTSEHSTPLPSTSEHSTPFPSTSEHSTPLPSTSEHSTPFPSTSEHSTPLPSTSEHSTSQPSTLEHSTPFPSPSQRFYPLLSTSEHSTSQPSTLEHSTPFPSTSQRFNPLPSTTEHSTPLPLTSQRFYPLPSTTEHSTLFLSTSEHSTPLPSTSQRFNPLPSTTEHSTPLPLTSEHSTPLPSTSEHSTPLPSTSQRFYPLPSTSEHSTPLPSTSEHSTPLPSTSEHSTPLPSTSEHSTPFPSTPQRFYPLPSTSEHSTPLPSTSEYSTPLPSTSEHSTPLPSTSEHSTPFPSTSEHSTPLPSTSEHSTPLPSTSEHSTPLPLSSEHSTSLPLSSEHSTSLPLSSEHSTPLPSSSQQSTPQYKQDTRPCQK